MRLKEGHTYIGREKQSKALVGRERESKGKRERERERERRERERKGGGGGGQVKTYHIYNN